MASNIYTHIAGESLTIEDITGDDEDSTPFPDGYLCYAEAFDSNNKILSTHNGSRDTEDAPFEIKIKANDTKSWDGNIAIIVTVTDASKEIAGKEKMLVKAENFGTGV